LPAPDRVGELDERHQRDAVWRIAVTSSVARGNAWVATAGHRPRASQPM